MRSEGLNKQLVAEKRQKQLDKVAAKRRTADRSVASRLGLKPVRQFAWRPKRRKSLPGQLYLFDLEETAER